MATIQRREGRWRAMVRRRGHATISRTFDARTDAEKWARRVEAAIDGGEHIDRRESERTLLHEALERYLRERVPEKKGACQEANRVRAWMRDPMARRSLASIRSTDVARWRDQRVAEGKAPTTVRNALTILSQVYVTAASDWGMEGLRNPIRGVRLPRHRPGRDRRLRPGDEERLLEACEHVGEPRLRPLVVLALETGMRLGELLALRRANVRGRVALLPDTKTGRPRSVPLSTKAVAALAELPARVDDLVLGLGTDRVEYVWRRACRLAGIEDLRFHDLRHEAVSRLFERGLTAEQVMMVSGHRTYAMLARYSHLRVSDELIERLG